MIISPTAVELFAGAGGLSVGLTKAGFNIVMANELEHDFANTYKLNHKKTHVLNCDIKQVDFAKELKNLGIESIDLLSGGPPCQGFSTIGSKKIEDPRNNLFYQFLRAIEEINPNYILFENVAGFKNLYNGKAYESFTQELCSLNYNYTSGVIDGSEFGLPQYRKRTIIVGWKKGLKEVKLPTPTHSDINNNKSLKKKVTLIEAISDLPPLKAGQSSNIYLTTENRYQKNQRSGEKILIEHNASNYGEKMKEILSLIPPNGTVEDLPNHLKPKSYFKNTYSRLNPNKPSPTITRNFGTPSSSKCIHPHQNRALSTREGARLQGFPDSYIFFGSKTSKNLQIGNSVPPIFGEVIAKEILLACLFEKRQHN